MASTRWSFPAGRRCWTTAHFDQSRPLQAARLSTLTDLHKQVLDKASALKARMQLGSDSRGEKPRPAGSNRLQADILCGRICVWEARRRDRERFRARADKRPQLPQALCAPTCGSDRPVQVLVRVTDTSDDEVFEVTCTSLLKGTSFVVEVDRVDRYGVLKSLISRRLGTDKFSLVNENSLPLRHLRDDFLIEGILDLTADALGLLPPNQSSSSMSVLHVA